jgi:hypothetical protein
MQKRFRTVALLAIAATMGCNDDFLTEVPADFVGPTNFYNNQDDALAAVNSVYASFVNLPSPLSSNDYLGRNFWMLVEYPTEVTTSRLSATNERSLMGNFHPQFAPTHSYLDGVWRAAYAGINRANAVIDRVPKVPMDTTRRNQIVAEAKFLRALHYYWLAGLFGGVPLKLQETTTIEGALIPRATVEETWAHVAKDLTEAAAVLPATWTGSNFGRATRGAALTLLGKSYMQSAATVPSLAANYQRAIDTFRTVQGLGYTLDANYASLFDGSNEQSREIIFSIQNIRVDGYGGRMTEWFAPITNPAIYQGGAQNQFQAERPFYDSYNAADVRKAGTWQTTLAYNNKLVTWAWTSGIQTSANYGSTGPVPRKYVDYGSADGGAEAPDYVILRHADVLLSTAEAINEISGPTAEAYGLVNQVRARARVPNLVAGLSKAAFKDSLFSDRRFELALELHGIFDSRRNWPWAKARIEANFALTTNSATSINRSPFTSSVEKCAAAICSPISDKWRLYPIPARAIELNPQLTQNPGW